MPNKWIEVWQFMFKHPVCNAGFNIPLLRIVTKADGINSIWLGYLSREVVVNRAVRVADQIIVLECILSKLLLQKQINVFAHAVWKKDK